MCCIPPHWCEISSLKCHMSSLVPVVRVLLGEMCLLSAAVFVLPFSPAHWEEMVYHLSSG